MAPSVAAVPDLPRTTDVLIVGGGVIGLTIALAVRRRFPEAGVTLIEKEAALGQHASGRNSGVLHAGFYYHADSLKAQMTRDGNARWRSYCHDRGLRVRECGKLVVARRPDEVQVFAELVARARANGVELQEISEAEAHSIEPRARTCERALFSPTTATVDPADVMRSLTADARESGVSLATGTRYLGRTGGAVRTSRGSVSAGFVVNAAGLHADRVAHDFGFAQDSRIVPFRGVYLRATDGSQRLATNVYPVPNLDQPFLGVHWTVTSGGAVKIGPTATPGFWREHYGGVRNFRLRECLEVVWDQLGVVRANPGFGRLARDELRKLRRRRLLHLASELVTGAGAPAAWRWGAPGVRAQLVDLRTHRLEMDFRIEGDGQSVHILNAVSPAFTCAFPFADLVLAQMTDPSVRGRGTDRTAG